MTEPTVLDLAADKALARRTARAARRAVHDPAAAAALVRRYPAELCGLGLTAGYWPVGSEIDCRPLLSFLAGLSVPLALPRMLDPGHAPALLRWRPGDALSPDAFGLLAPDPAAGAEAAVARVVLCPLLAFDRAGRRLGQGGGHYDRLLAAWKPMGAVAVGLAYAAQEANGVPWEPHDQRLDWIVTEREAIRASGA